MSKVGGKYDVNPNGATANVFAKSNADNTKYLGPAKNIMKQQQMNISMQQIKSIKLPPKSSGGEADGKA